MIRQDALLSEPSVVFHKIEIIIKIVTTPSRVAVRLQPAQVYKTLSKLLVKQTKSPTRAKKLKYP